MNLWNPVESIFARWRDILGRKDTMKCAMLVVPFLGINALLWRFFRCQMRSWFDPLRRHGTSQVITKKVKEATEFRTRDLGVVRNLDLGACMQWEKTLLSRMDPERTVSVHRSAECSLDFVGKNFKYEVITFREMVHKMNDPEEKEFWYYRALDPKRKAVHLHTVSPGIVDDFVCPALPSGAEVHSTVLRLQSPKSQVWLHYDVLDNILCQVLGSKRVIFFEPKWAGHLYLDGSSSTLGASFFQDIDRTLRECPLFADAWADRIEVVLHPGDAVAIPAFWCHATQGVSETGMSCSVNTFFALAPNEVNGKDAWANKDPQKAQDAAKLVAKAKSLLRELPLQDQRIFFRILLQRELSEL